MRNDFEKQVRDKMDELHFAPSEPVWGKIEEQIRYKKDRRRVILWIPVLVALLAGGMWWLNTTGERTRSLAETERTMELPLPSITESSNNNNNNNTTAPNTTRNHQLNTPETQPPASSDDAGKVQLPERTLSKESGTLTAKMQQSHTAIVRQRGSLAIGKKPAEQIPGTRTEKISTNNTADPVRESGVVMQAPTNEKPVTMSSVNDERTLEVKRTIIPVSMGNSNPQMPAPRNHKDLRQSLKKEDISVAPVAALPGVVKSKWRFGLTGEGGFSGNSGTIRLLPGTITDQPSFAGTNVQPPVVYPNQQQPEIRKSLAFSIGLTVKRAIGKRFVLSSGLEYNYYSTSTQVGYKIMNNQSFTGTADIRNGFVPAANSEKIQDYFNEFHFLSVPLQLEWQVLKKRPLHLRAGIAGQRLLHTNALTYKKQSMLLMTEEQAFSKTQLFTSLGADYAVLNRKATLLVGPELRYGVTPYDRENKDHHLFSFGIRAQYLFKK